MSRSDLVITIQPTPNPNSVKCVINARPADAPKMYSDAASADTPLAAALLAIPGVQSTFLHPDFVTVTRDPSTDFADIQPQIEAAFRAHLSPK